APSVQGKYDTQLLALAASHELPTVRTQLLRTLAARAIEPAVVDSLYEIWRRADSPLLSANDYTTLAYELAVRLPAQADSILATQRTRITNPDRLAQFDFISPSVSPSAAVRDSVFRSLAEVANRSVEPWVRTMLTYLNHPLRQADAVKYILPALELLPEIQRTGDIFFPITWCKSLLAGHRSAAARAEVDRYLADNPALLPLLRNKVLEAAYPLTRQNRSQ
ncbi:MAG: aminopeptidase, partial [Muribaculaceae bacterium]|nr:aminopeptidase [Muribaculaceae bacterium]